MLEHSDKKTEGDSLNHSSRASDRICESDGADKIKSAVTGVASQGLSLQLSTTDLCFLVALHLRSQSRQMASFGEEQLEDVFAHVCELVAPEDTEVVRNRARAIARLREQRVLIRVDGLGVVRAPEYALTRLASAIVEYILEDEVLTRESLMVLTQTLAVTLTQVLKSAEEAQGDSDWNLVAVPLQVTIRELLRGVERRQRGLDQQQERFQTTIRGLLDADWFGAIGDCQQLLEDASATLKELSDLLLQGSTRLLALLQDIQELALEAKQMESAQAAHLLIDSLDQMVAWGGSRQRAWSDYFQYVHRFLRDVVRLDPTRALTQRLREQLAGKNGRSFSLAIASARPVTLLREMVIPEDKPPVTRPKAKREKPPKEEKLARDPQAELEGKVSESLAKGALSLHAVTAELTTDMDQNQGFLHAGRIAQALANVSHPVSARQRPWTQVGDNLLIEDWSITKTAKGES